MASDRGGNGGTGNVFFLFEKRKKQRKPLGTFFGKPRHCEARQAYAATWPRAEAIQVKPYGLGPRGETGGRGTSSFFSKKERSKENLLGLFSVNPVVARPGRLMPPHGPAPKQSSHQSRAIPPPAFNLRSLIPRQVRGQTCRLDCFGPRRALTPSIRASQCRGCRRRLIIMFCVFLRSKFIFH